RTDHESPTTDESRIGTADVASGDATGRSGEGARANDREPAVAGSGAETGSIADGAEEGDAESGASSEPGIGWAVGHTVTGRQYAGAGRSGAFRLDGCGRAAGCEVESRGTINSDAATFACVAYGNSAAGWARTGVRRVGRQRL